MSQPARADSIIMVAIAAAALVIGAVLLAVVPRGDRVPTAVPPTSSASTRPVPTGTPTRVPAAPPVDDECTDAELTARLVPPADAAEARDPLVWPPMTNIEWVATLWDNGGPQGALLGQLVAEQLEGCAYLQWQPRPTATLTVVLMRLPTAAGAQRVAVAANTALDGHAAAADLVLNPDDPNRLVGTDLGGGLHTLTGVLFRDRYAACIRLVPLDSDDDWTLTRRVADAQYALLGPA